jgi:signal peptidase I
MRLHAWMRTACLTICLLAGSAGAQSPAPSPEAMAAARELIVTMRAAEYFKAIMPAIMNNLKPAIVQNRSQVERDYDAMMPLLIASVDARLNEIMEQNAAVYARNFTAKELREIVAFYRRPTGQKIVQRLPLMTQESMLIGQRLAETVGAEIRVRMVDELRKRGHDASAREERIRIMTMPSGSMLPTIPVGEAVGVVPTEQLRIGDVVTFYLPKDMSTIYMKRVVGMGGDRIQMIDGVLNINGQAVKRERVEDYIPVEKGVPGKPIRRWRETLPNGVSHMTLDLVDNGFYDNTPVYKVPQNHYFMMGDNRDSSTDSRSHSVWYIPVDNITGKVCCLVYPLSMDKTGTPGLP